MSRFSGKPRHASRLACAVALGTAAGLAGAAVEFEPQVTTGITFTDNVTLASANRDSETVVQLMPSFRLLQSARRLSTTVDYNLDAYYYTDRSDSNIFHRFNAQTRAALHGDNLFLTAGGSRSQVIEDPSEPVPFGNLPISSNRTDRDEWFLGPDFRYPLGSNLTASGSFRRSWISFDDTSRNLGPFSVRDFTQDAVQAGVDNYRRGRGATWALRYSSQATEYDLFQPWEYRQASLEVGTWIGDSVRIFASGGKESAWDDPFDASLVDEFWEVGLSTQGGERFTVELAAGERTYGASRRASLNYRFRRGQTGLSFTRQPTTQGRDPLSGFVPDDLLNRPGSVERYVSERLRWNVGFDLRRTDLSFRLFDEKRESRLRFDGLPLPEERQTGAGATANWRAGVRTTISLDAQRSDREYSFNDKTRRKSFAFNVRYDLGAKTDLAFRYMRSEEESLRGVGFRNYSANVYSLLLTRRFWTAQ